MIREKILAAHHWISFEDYMNLALYAPGMGYYSSGATKLGSAGDFVTAPEISPLFGRTLAQQLGVPYVSLGAVGHICALQAADSVNRLLGLQEDLA